MIPPKENNIEDSNGLGFLKIVYGDAIDQLKGVRYNYP